MSCCMTREAKYSQMCEEFCSLLYMVCCNVTIPTMHVCAKSSRLLLLVTHFIRSLHHLHTWHTYIHRYTQNTQHEPDEKRERHT